RKTETFSKGESSTGGGMGNGGKHTSSGEIIDFPIGKVSHSAGNYANTKNCSRLIVRQVPKLVLKTFSDSESLTEESGNNVGKLSSREVTDFPRGGKAKAHFPKADDKLADGKRSLSDDAPTPSMSANGKSGKLSTITREEALADLRKVMAQSGDVPSQRTLSIRWGVREGTISKWCRRWERAGEISRRKSGKCQEVVGEFASLHCLHEAGRA